MNASVDGATSGDFFGWAGAYVTPAMEAHGYVVCAEGAGMTDDRDRRLRRVRFHRAAAVRDRILSSAPWRTRRPLRCAYLGYEGEGGNEYWLTYVPERRWLDLEWWMDVLQGHADWDVRSREPVAREELRRRLRLVGHAVAASHRLDDD